MMPRFPMLATEHIKVTSTTKANDGKKSEILVGSVVCKFNYWSTRGLREAKGMCPLGSWT